MDRRAALGLTAFAATAALAAPAQAKGGGGGSSAPVAYTRIDTLTANVTRSDGRRGILSVEMGVNADDTALSARVVQSVPRIRAACAAVVQRNAGGLAPNAPPDVERLGRELQAAVDGALGRAGGKVLLGTVMVS